MLTRKILMLTLCLVFLLTALPSSQLSAQDDSESDAPYIYYYSDWLNSFVIERADGSDSRLFGQGVVTSETSVVRASWSPSGKWFLVQTKRNSGYVYHHLEYYLFNIDGEVYPTLLTTFGEIESVSWLPEDDILIFSQETRVTSEVGGERRYWVDNTTYWVDVEANQIIQSRTINNYPQDELISVHRISLENGTVIYYYLDGRLMEYIIRVIRRDGSTTERFIQPTEYSIDSLNLSGNGWIVYYNNEQDQTMLLNAVTTQEINLPISKPSSVTWSDQGQRAFIYVPSEVNPNEQVLWYLDLRNLQVDIKQFALQGHVRRFFEDKNHILFEINEYLYWVNLTDFSHILVARVEGWNYHFDAIAELIPIYYSGDNGTIDSIAIFDMNSQQTQYISLVSSPPFMKTSV